MIQTMKHVNVLVMLALASALPLSAQFPRPVQYIPSAPTGACASNVIQYVTIMGTLYTCQSGTWTILTGGTWPGYPGGTGIPTVTTGSAWGTTLGFTNANTPSTIVQRDASGNFAAGTITANLKGDFISTAAIAVNSPPTLMCFGDSVCASNGPETDNATYSFEYANGWLTWANYLLGMRFNTMSSVNIGIGGNTTTQMLARISTVIGYHPTFVVVQGGTNDLNATATATAIMANLVSIYTQLQAAGIRPIASTVVPAHTGVEWEKLNTLICQYTQANGVPLLDLASVLTDPASNPENYATSLTTDTVHPNPKGAYLIGAAIASVLGQLTPPLSNFPSNNLNTYNLVPNGMMSGTGGTLGTGTSGVVATSWTLLSAGSIGAKVARTDTPGEWQQSTITCGGTACTTTLYQDIPAAVGVPVVLAAEIDMSGNAGVSVLQIHAQIQFKNAGGTQIGYADCFNFSSTSELNIPIGSGVMRSFPLAAPVGTAGATIQIQLKVPALGTGVIRIGRVTMMLPAL